MTVESCKRLLAHYESAMADSSLSELARANMKTAYAEMKARLAVRDKQPSTAKQPSKK